MGLLNDIEQWVDQRKRAYGNAARGLLNDPQNTIDMWKAQDAEAARGNRYTQMSAGSVMPEVAQQGQEAMLNAALNVGGLLGITAYHGSPHTFDKFDMSKIGTGEGAQAYGHGLYFAENPEVAKQYAGMSKPNPKDVDISLLEAAKDFIKHGMNPTDGLKSAYKSASTKEIEDAVLMARGGYKPNLMKVDIPDEAVAKMLDWDKPLSQQPEAVRKALGNVAPMALTDGMPLAGGGKLRIANDPDFGPKYFLEMGDSKMRLNAADVQNLVGSGLEGKSLYQGLKAKLGSDDKVSAYLKQQGIPGIRYLDAGSRGKGGTSNFVLFDDNLPKILSRE